MPVPVDSVLPVVAVALGIAVLATALATVGHLVRLAAHLLVLPGVVVHELAHKCACDLVGVPVLEVAYFRLGDPSGYVRHARPERYRESFAISVAPFLVNTVVSFTAFLGLAALVTTAGGVTAPSALLERLSSSSSDLLATAAVLGWVGLTVGLQAFPSTGDANTLWARSRAEWRRSPVVLVGVPVVLVIYVANLLSRLWADVLYAVGLGVAAFYAVGALAV